MAKSSGWTTVSISMETRALLGEVAAHEGQTIKEALHRAVTMYAKEKLPARSRAKKRTTP